MLIGHSELGYPGMVGPYVAGIFSLMGMLHCFIGLHLQNTNSEIILGISEWQQQTIKPSMRSCMSQEHDASSTLEEMRLEKQARTRPCRWGGAI